MAPSKREGFGHDSASFIIEPDKLPFVHQQLPENPRNYFSSKLQVSRSIFLAICIAIWCLGNSMNGVSMQKLATSVPDNRNYFTTATFVTVVQLLTGALMAAVLLRLLASASPTSIDKQGAWGIGILHAIGSLATNLGFFWSGSATLVQTLKLLEPFEVLLFSVLLQDRKRVSVGLLCSMIVTLAGARMLIQTHYASSTSIQTLACVLVSGLALSLRNVTYRRRNTNSEKEIPESTVAVLLETSIRQFAQMSWQAALVLMIPLALDYLAHHVGRGGEQFGALFKTEPSWMLWHPLYNIFSVITLAFCSALTHSLWNAGKRVFAIIVAGLWFQEDLWTERSTSTGLLLVTVGALWYARETHVSSKTGKQGIMRWIKPLITFVLIRAGYYQSFEQEYTSKMA